MHSDGVPHPRKLKAYIDQEEDEGGLFDSGHFSPP